MKRIPRYVIILIAISLLGTSGCGTILSQIVASKGQTIVRDKEEYEEETCGVVAANIYSGVLFDTRVLANKCKGGGESGMAFKALYPLLVPLCLIDYPLSLVADTIILPYTGYKQIKYGNLVIIKK